MKNPLRKRFGLIEPSENEIALYWYPGQKSRNFGDQLGPYLVKKISGKMPVYRVPFGKSPYYMTVGSILGSASAGSIIWGSGLLRSRAPSTRPQRICAVRGPMTRDVLLAAGWTCPQVYGDPALLLPKYYQPSVKKEFKIGIIPHYVDYKKILAKAKPHFHYINVLDPVEQVIDEINQCEFIISSSLHGVIAAHAYGIPAVVVRFSNRLYGDGIKFSDYFQSVGMTPYQPILMNDSLPNQAELIKLVNKMCNRQAKIDLDRLLESCPFAQSS